MTEFKGVAAQIAEIIGDKLTHDLLARRGGMEITIPVRAKGSMLAEIIGEAAARDLSIELGAGRIVLPCSHLRGAGARRAEAKRMLAQGASIAEAARACGLHTRTVAGYRMASARGDDPQMTLF